MQPYCPTKRLCPKTTATTPHPRLGFLSSTVVPRPTTDFSALRRYVGRIRFFIHSRSQPNNYYSSCRFRTAHRKDHFRRLTLRAAARQEVTPMVQTARFELANPKILHIGAVSTQLLPAYCSLRAEPKPRPSGKEGGKEKEWRCRVCPCISHDKVRFFNFSTFKWNFQNYFSAISTTQG